MVKMLGKYSEGSSLIEKGGFFCFGWSFPISKITLGQLTWTNQRYL